MPLAPEYEAMFKALAEEPGPKISDLSPAEGREMYRVMRALNPELSIGSVEDRQIETNVGSIPVRIYRPGADGPLPILMNFHGGGWVIGDLDTADAVCRGLAEAAGCIVISVDYRLAPEHVYPAAVDDAYAATCWAAANAEALGGSGKAGGNRRERRRQSGRRSLPESPGRSGPEDRLSAAGLSGGRPRSQPRLLR